MVFSDYSFRSLFSIDQLPLRKKTKKHITGLRVYPNFLKYSKNYKDIFANYLYEY
jgi:hypothetical protein